MDYTTLWDTVLAELQMQMTQAMFDQCLRSTTAIEREGALEVAVGGEYAQEWLENRLRTGVEQTVARVAGEPLAVRFVVANGAAKKARGEEEAAPQEQASEEAEERGFVVPEFDVHELGWFPVAEYECRFWAPVVGRIGWRVWEIVRRADKRKKKKTLFTPARRWTAPALAEMVPCGRQALLGVNRKCEPGTPGAVSDENGQWRYHQAGAFDRLEELGIAQIEQEGERRHTSYWLSVRVSLGLLYPGLIRELPGRLQVQHDRWLEAHGFEPNDWRA